jgi:hypothetical protein
MDLLTESGSILNAPIAQAQNWITEALLNWTLRQFPFTSSVDRVEGEGAREWAATCW